MVSSVASSAALAYTATTSTSFKGAGGVSATATADGGASTSATATGSALAVTVTLSSNAQRLQTAINNLNALDTGKTSLLGVWTSDWNQAGSVGFDQESAADAEVAALPTSDPGHITQATAAQSFVKAKITSGGNAVVAKNPFAGFSTQALTAIISDKSGLYTKYEKAAAAYEYQDQQNSWVNEYGPGNPANDNASGKAAFFSKAISVFDALPALIQASYNPSYLQSITKLQRKYASGQDDDTDPSFFGNADGTRSSALLLLKNLAERSSSDPGNEIGN